MAKSCTLYFMLSPNEMLGDGLGFVQGELSRKGFARGWVWNSGSERMDFRPMELQLAIGSWPEVIAKHNVQRVANNNPAIEIPESCIGQVAIQPDFKEVPGDGFVIPAAAIEVALPSDAFADAMAVCNNAFAAGFLVSGTITVSGDALEAVPSRFPKMEDVDFSEETWLHVTSLNINRSGAKARPLRPRAPQRKPDAPYSFTVVQPDNISYELGAESGLVRTLKIDGKGNRGLKGVHVDIELKPYELDEYYQLPHEADAGTWAYYADNKNLHAILRYVPDDLNGPLGILLDPSNALKTKISMSFVGEPGGTEDCDGVLSGWDLQVSFSRDGR